MPTFEDPTADAQEAAEAVRGLAHAIRHAEHPRATYPVLGELLSIARRLIEVTDQLSGNLVQYRRLASDDQGNMTAGGASVQESVNGLQEAAGLFDRAESAIDRATQAAAQIAWHTPTGSPTARRYVSIVFLQGEAADELIGIIDRAGTSAAIEHLAQFDHGSETVDVALENGNIYDEPPVGKLDRTAAHAKYTLVYNPFLSHIGLYRQHHALPDPELLGINIPMTTRSPQPAADIKASPPSGDAQQPRTRRDRLGSPPPLDDFSDDSAAMASGIAL